MAVSLIKRSVESYRTLTFVSRLHCHVAWHISEGMNINFLEQTPSVQKEMEIPYTMAQTCRDWSAWTGDHVVPQIDSGL